jgi:hypothetical protein
VDEHGPAEEQKAHGQNLFVESKAFQESLEVSDHREQAEYSQQ